MHILIFVKYYQQKHSVVVMASKLAEFDWNKTKAFLATADSGSYSAASKLLKVAQPTLGRQVAALEEELGVVLFERMGKSMQLTPSGVELLEHVRQMAEAANNLALAASGKSTEIEGTVCVSASEVYSVFLLPEILAKLKRVQPKIKIRILASNESSDLIRREADIAIRNYRPQQPDLIAKKLPETRFFFYASPKYLKRKGELRKKSDLSSAEFIGFSDVEALIVELSRHGIEVNADNFPYLASSHYTHWELVKKGLGIGLMVESIGDREPVVQKILPREFPKMKVENWLVCHRDLKNSRRIRVVYDFLHEELLECLK